MKITKELKIGVFVVAVLTATFFIVNFLRGEDLLNREIEMSARFDDVEGLVVSAPVYIKGYKAGKVYDVNYNPELQDFEVICSIDKNFLIPSDSRMVIYSTDIMGGKGVRIEMGKSHDMAGEGSVLSAGREAGIVDALAASAVPLMEKVSSSLDSLDAVLSNLTNLLAPDNQASIRRTLVNIEKTAANLSRMGESLEDKSADVYGIIDDLAVLSEKLNIIAGQTGDIMTDVSTIVADNVGTDIKSPVASLDTLLRNLNNQDGIVTSLDQILHEVDSLLAKINENPRKYLRLSIF